MRYKYITENNLEDIQTYMYSEFAGKDFLVSYFESRESVIHSIDDAITLEGICNYMESVVRSETATELYNIWCRLCRCYTKEIKGSVDKYVKRFEVKKRIYNKYFMDGKIVPDSDYNEYISYLLLGLILVDTYQINGNLKYISCLLKVTDTLASVEEKLDKTPKAIFKYILIREIDFIKELMSGI